MKIAIDIGLAIVFCYRELRYTSDKDEGVGEDIGGTIWYIKPLINWRM